MSHTQCACLEQAGGRELRLLGLIPRTEPPLHTLIIRAPRKKNPGRGQLTKRRGGVGW